MLLFYYYYRNIIVRNTGHNKCIFIVVLRLQIYVILRLQIYVVVILLLLLVRLKTLLTNDTEYIIIIIKCYHQQVHSDCN